ncbi:MAG: AbrB/MazE/SpoVT family DNA-binding domain-containing protein [Candidatus Micrarchaeales archaeon]
MCCGDNIPKVYKSKSNNKLIVTIPYDVIEALGIKDGDDLDFLKYGERTFLVARKNDIVKLLSKSTTEEKVVEERQAYTGMDKVQLETKELEVLKKLDTLKYNDRTISKVNAMLNGNEKETLQVLLKKKVIVPFKKTGEKESHYSIQKSIYDRFLYRKNKVVEVNSAVDSQQTRPKSQVIKTAIQPVQKAWEQKLGEKNAYVDILESKGFLVLNNEGDAAMVSATLEDSIRQGLVLGTRAFNKKFYIGLRGFINRHAPKILKIIEQKSVNAEQIAKETGLEEDAVRTILYVLSESGDVTEVRRDLFRAA